MICLKSLTFVVSITTEVKVLHSSIGCDLLEKSYLCGINNNTTKTEKRHNVVVICLKSLTFVVSITTQYERVAQLYRCDLLEKSYLCGINNNAFLSHCATILVVICLKSLTFVVSITTVRLRSCL